MGWACLVVAESPQMNDETNVSHTGHQNLSVLEQSRAGKHVGLVTRVRTIMSLPFTCSRSSQRSVSTVALIKRKHLPMVSGTWHFPDKSMCADRVQRTYTLSLRFLGSIKAYSYSVQTLKINIFGVQMAHRTLESLVCTVRPELPRSTELWAPETVGIFRRNGYTIS